MKKLFLLFLFISCFTGAAAQVLQDKNWTLLFTRTAPIKQLRGEVFMGGQPESHLDLGRAYLLANGKHFNLRKAKHHLKKAAKKDISEAQLLLALIPTLEKRKNPKKLKQSFQTILQLAQADYPLAQYALAHFYFFERGTSDDPAERVKWLTRAATARPPVPRAQNQLAVYYYDGFAPYIEQDKKRAFELFLSAAEANDEYAAYNVARMYERGENIEKNEQRAFYFMRQAARHKLVEAQMALSQYYTEGIGTQPDAYGTFSWMLAAAQQNDVQAQEKTALHYWQGIGVRVNHKEALSWAEKAKKNGSPQADKLIKQIKDDMK